MKKAQVIYWAKHYDQLADNAPPWLDYSNERTQQQSLALCLEAIGSVLNRRCLDVGCGNGQLSLILRALGASEVVGTDNCRKSVQALRKKHPAVKWVHGDGESASTYGNLGSFDAIFAVEVLQYMDFDRTMNLLLNHLRPGGRLIVLVPNKACPIVRKVIDRYRGKYICPTPEQFRLWALARKDVQRWHVRGLRFQKDQRWVPYTVTSWTMKPAWVNAPNRLLFAVEKRSGVLRSTG